MKRTFALLFFLLLLYCNAPAQEFLKLFGDADYGRSPRILPTAIDNGWVVLSMDSFCMTKFNNCGIPQWSKKYSLPNAYPTLNDFIRTQDGGFAVLTCMRYDANRTASLVTKIDVQGNILWCKSYEDLAHRHFPYTLSEDVAGNIILFSNIENISNNNTYNMICRINANGTLISTNFYDHGWVWGGAITTSDNGVLIRTGNTLIKTTNTGTIQWVTSFLGTYYYLSPIEMSDGFILTGYTNPGNKVSFYKFSLQGNLLWGGLKETNYSGNPPQMKKHNNQKFSMAFPNSTIEFDKDLNILHHTTYNSTLNVTARNLCFLGNGTPVLAGISTTSPQVFYSKLNDNYQSICDSAPIPMTFTLDTSALFSTTVIHSTYTMNEVNHIFPVDTFSVVPELVCKKVVILGDDQLVCSYPPYILRNLNTEQFETYLWSTNETTREIGVTTSGTYWLRVKYNCGQDSLADTINIVFETPIEVDLGSDVLGCENEPHVFNAMPCDSCSYLWSDGSTADTLRVVLGGNYWLHITDSSGCVYGDTVAYITSKCECDLYIPNSFTPNNDGKNEVFQPLYYCDLADFNLKIYNRLGQPVFYSDNVSASWDGKHKNTLVQSGVYFYSVNYTPILKGKENKTLSRTGFVTVIY